MDTIATKSGPLSPEEFKVRARSFIDEQMNAGKGGQAAIEELMQQVDESCEQWARELAEEVLRERLRAKADHH
ncbi:MAG TPA: hypothetical protein VFD92_25855 [Candidatus Binatia bacterium]|nr:hypothetical protein [Candidatus Binatia bacterium]